jgi:hypothetical protein
MAGASLTDALSGVRGVLAAGARRLSLLSTDNSQAVLAPGHVLQGRLTIAGRALDVLIG